MSWKEEAVGIEPWASAAKVVGAQFIERTHTGATSATGEPYAYTTSRVIYVPDLEDPDTLAAFDRRLALRWGAPSTRDGVLVFIAYGPVLRIHAAEAGHRHGEIWTEWSVSLGLDTDDPLLARVRAWKSV